MPLFKVSVESDVPASAIVLSTAPTEAEALAEVRLLQSRARVNWRRGLTAIGAVEAPYEIWAQKAPIGWTVSLYALIPISAIISLVAEDSESVNQTVAERQSAGLIKWAYRGIPVGEYKEPIPTSWSNQLPDEPTSTSLDMSTFGTYPGQSVTLSSDVTGEDTPVGNLEFRDQVTNAVIVPTTLEPDPVTAGLAHAQATVVLPAGVYDVQAVFLGSDGYQTSSSTPITLTVAKISSTTTITPPTPPIYAGQSVSLSVYVTHGVPSAAKPTGTITLFEGLTVVGSTQLNTSGPFSAGSFSLGTLPPGTYSFTVQYSGDAIHNGSSNTVVGVQVLQAPTTIYAVITQTNETPFPPEQPEFSQTVRINAIVTSVVPGTVPTGTVTFKEGMTTLGTGAMVAFPGLGDNVAKAFLDKADFTVATHSSLTAEYPGNPSFAASTSGPQSVIVSKAFTSVNAFSANSPTVFGQTAFFDATVGVQSPGTITPFQQYGVGGSVSYKDSGVVTVNFDGTGHAIRSVSNLPVGTNEVGVTYFATAEFNNSFNSFPHVVQKANTTIVVHKSPDPSGAFQNVNLSATVSVVAPGAGTVTGTVSFEADDNIFGPLFLGSSAVSSGSASFLVLYNTFPIYAWYFGLTLTGNIKATYSGDSNFNSSVGTTPYTVFPF
jgi:hypothetical protein